MKRSFTFLKLFFVCSIMLIAFQSSAQQITSTDQTQLNVGPATATVPAFDKTKAIFCPTNNFTLTASLTDINGNAFATYEWYAVNSAGGADAIAGSTSQSLAIANATPGYHTYRVYGVEDYGNSQTCKADAFEDFTVYVLPPLTVLATVPNSDVLKYCTDNVPGTTPATNPIVFTATSAFSGVQNSVSGLTNPTLPDFKIIYTWYKTDLAGTKIGAALQSGISPNYTVAETVVGSFKYMVEVTYDVKTACPYNAVVTQNNTEAVVTVTPKPGKPTITIN